MTNQVSPVDRSTVTLRRISPCEHGIRHGMLSVAEGVTHFSIPECTDSKGNARNHMITAEKYPETERKR